ncbi:Putative uncharacterized protein [Lactobacillus delbrueckii subsp. lactis]|nr:Putative uncharacterized protein [Lactobacillus delbrueckii subsp. lactis]
MYQHESYVYLDEAVANAMPFTPI